ncbi:hypothetical protein [uncultured Devosia sp.]|uniref:hypothetical protein n=1 Tax=uncultured Devosia sp. TaxID=211434 RepID=UPI0035CC0C02
MAQLSLTEFRQKYPQYQGKSDEELAGALHRKFYSTVPREEFNARIGLVAPGNVSTMTPEFNDALAAGSARSQVFDDYQPQVYAQPTDGLPVPRPGVNGPSQNVVQTGMLENIGAGIDSGANKVLGAPVDLPVWVGNSLVNAANSGIEMTGNGRPIPNIPNDLPGSSQGWERTQESLGFTPPSKVIPGDSGQAVARAAAEATTMAAIPETLAIKAGQVIQQAPRAVQVGIDTIEALFGRSNNAGAFARNMSINAAAGGGAQAAMEVSPDELKPFTGLAGGLTAATAAYGLTRLPEGIAKAVQALGEYLAPLSAKGQERAAGTILRDSATSPGNVIDAIETAPGQFVTDSQPTTFQQTGDMGLGALERSVATKSPEVFTQRAADQNAARVAAVEGVQPTGAPEEVVTSIRTFMDDIERQAEQAVADVAKQNEGSLAALGAEGNAANAFALGNARGSANALGMGAAPEVAGGRMREMLETARAQAKAQERALWQAVDPDGNLSLSAQNTKAGATQIRNEMPTSAKPMSGEEQAIFDVLGQYGDNVPFSELTALQSRLKAELRAERIANGESPAYRRLSMLNGAIQQDIEAAVIAKVQQDAQAVAAGTMDEMDSIAANVARQVEAFLAKREAQVGQIGGTGAGQIAGGRPTGISGSPGTAVPSGGRPGNAQGSPRLPQDGAGAPVDRAAVERLNAARSATRRRVDTFDNPTLAPIRKRPATNAPYSDPAATVPSRIFVPGPKAPEAIQRFRAAVGDEQALPVLRDYAVDRLRKAALTDDGMLDPNKAMTWLRQHQEAMRAFPELETAVRQAVRDSEETGAVAMAQREAIKAAETEAERRIASTVKAAKQQVDEAQAGVLGRLMGLSDPEDITRTIGSIFGRQDAVKGMRLLVNTIGDNASAKEGLRKAIADHIVKKFVGVTESATSGVGTIKGAQFQDFVKQQRKALEVAGFTEAELGLMDDIAADLQRSNRSVSAVKLPGGSNTAQDTSGKLSMLVRAVVGQSKTHGTGVAAGILFGPWVGVPVWVGTQLTTALRRNGIENIDGLVRDALLNPARARALMIKAAPKEAKERAIDLAQMYRQAATVTYGAVMGERPQAQEKPAPPPRLNALGARNPISGAALGSQRLPQGNSLSFEGQQPRALGSLHGRPAGNALGKPVPAWIGRIPMQPTGQVVQGAL